LSFSSLPNDYQSLSIAVDLLENHLQLMLWRPNHCCQVEWAVTDALIPVSRAFNSGGGSDRILRVLVTLVLDCCVTFVGRLRYSRAIG
jgi:hypothetical protein